MHKVYDKDQALQSNLKKAHKLSYRSLHPGNNKQNVSLALSIFDETTIAAIKSYFPERDDMSSFLENFQKWWTIANSKQRFSPNPLGNAAVAGDGKTHFFMALANWVEEWQTSPAFTLTSNTSSALILTLRAQTMLIEELLQDGYSYVLLGRFQSDPLERRFSQYRQMSGGRFLVSLREVLNSERILACRSLILEDLNFWKENIRPDEYTECIQNLFAVLDTYNSEIQESVLNTDSLEVATTIAGYIAKQLAKRSNCIICKEMFTANGNSIANDKYLNLLSRGGLTVPSPNLADFVCNCFAVLDFVGDHIQKHEVINVRQVSNDILHQYGPRVDFTCVDHMEWGFNFATKSIINIFFNNKEKNASDSVRKDAVVDFKKRQRLK